MPFVNYLHPDPVSPAAPMINTTSYQTRRSIFLVSVYLVFFCALIPSAVFSQITKSDPFLDEQKMNHVQELVDHSVSDSRAADAAELKAMIIAEQQRESQRLQSIQTEPNLGPYLAALAEKATTDQSSKLQGVFQAMALRQDVDPAVIQFYIRKAQTLLESNPEKLRSYDYNLLMGVPYLLTMQATPLNEDLLLKILKLSERYNDTHFIDVAGAALAKIGSERALSPLEEAIKWAYQHRDDMSNSQFAARIEGYLTKLRTRTHGTYSTSAYPSPSTPEFSLLADAANHTATEENYQHGILWVSFGVILFGAVGIIWWFRTVKNHE